MSVAKDIEDANVNAARQAAEAERLAELSKLYPDLQKYVGRWNKVAYYSKTVNAAVTNVDIRHNCGCCSDSPLEAWPFIETPHGRVYSDPSKFWVGQRSDYAESGERPDEGWDTKMRDAKIPEAVIARVGAYMGVAVHQSGVAEEKKP